MPWKECHVMDERLRFVARLLEGEKMAPLCAEFGISRKTGDKIYDRYKDRGVTAFTDRAGHGRGTTRDSIVSEAWRRTVPATVAAGVPGSRRESARLPFA